MVSFQSCWFVMEGNQYLLSLIFLWHDTWPWFQKGRPNGRWHPCMMGPYRGTKIFPSIGRVMLPHDEHSMWNLQKKVFSPFSRIFFRGLKPPDVRRCSKCWFSTAFFGPGVQAWRELQVSGGSVWGGQHFDSNWSFDSFGWTCSIRGRPYISTAKLTTWWRNGRPFPHFVVLYRGQRC